MQQDLSERDMFMMFFCVVIIISYLMSLCVPEKPKPFVRYTLYNQQESESESEVSESEVSVSEESEESEVEEYTDSEVEVGHCTCTCNKVPKVEDGESWLARTGYEPSALSQEQQEQDIKEIVQNYAMEPLRLDFLDI